MIQNSIMLLLISNTIDFVIDRYQLSSARKPLLSRLSNMCYLYIIIKSKAILF